MVSGPFREGEISRVLVTGGAGFIGYHLINYMDSLGYTLLSVDLVENALLPPRVQQVCASVLDFSAMSRMIRDFRPHAVIHLAAETDVGKNQRFPDDFPVNTKGMRILIDVMQRYKINRLMAVSTQFVNGPAVPAGAILREFMPHTEYGKSKVVMETDLRNYGEALEWTVLRPVYIWGPFGSPRFMQLADTLARRAYLHPRGTHAVRTYGYVKNAVFQIERLLSNLLARKATFYLGDPPIDSLTFLNALSTSLTGRPVRQAPISVLRTMAAIGDATGLLPIDRFRLQNMTQDYVVPMQETYCITGRGPLTLDVAVSEFSEWYASLPRRAPSLASNPIKPKP